MADAGSLRWRSRFISVDERSTYLIFASDKAPTKGSFEVLESPPPDFPVPPGDDEIPEPGTIALISVGTGLSWLRRTRKRRGA